MCTAISFDGRYFGRTLDYERSFGEQIVITPTEYQFKFRQERVLKKHFAIIGMATVVDEYPLYFDAINEKGVGMAGLNFVGNARYFASIHEKENISPFEFIPWVLGQCATVEEARQKLCKVNLADIPFSKELPLAPLHWMISDAKESVVVESVADGLKLYDNPVGVLTNNPPFPMQLFNLNNYRHLSRSTTENTFLPDVQLEAYSRGMGAIGLPGDTSSASRFVRAAFVKSGSIHDINEADSIIQFFHILRAVEQQRGFTVLENGEYEITRYTSCCDLSKGIYYYTTYNNFCITAVSLPKNANGSHLLRYQLRDDPTFYYEN